MSVDYMRRDAKTVLIADDETDLAYAIGARLFRHGHRVEFAHDGATVVYKAKRSRPNLILLDLRMPAGDGLTVCHQLKNDPDTWDIPIIILTAHGDEKARQEAKRYGVKFFLRKPYSAPELVSCIDEVLAGAA